MLTSAPFVGVTPCTISNADDSDHSSMDDDDDIDSNDERFRTDNSDEVCTSHQYRSFHCVVIINSEYLNTAIVSNRLDMC